MERALVAARTTEILRAYTVSMTLFEIPFVRVAVCPVVFSLPARDAAVNLSFVAVAVAQALRDPTLGVVFAVRKTRPTDHQGEPTKQGIVVHLSVSMLVPRARNDQ